MQDPVSITIASYEVKAAEYIRKTDKLSYFPDLPGMLEKFVSLLPGYKVLDVAFGSGRDTCYLIEQGLDVEGIELTQAFIDTLSKKVSIPLHKMDMRQLEFADATFDGIWCCSAFLHLPRVDALPTLQGFFRVLRSGGILYLDLKKGDGDKWVAEPDGNVSNVARYYTYYSLDEICQLLTRADFEILFTRKQKHIQQNIKSDKPRWLNLICRKPV